MNCKHYHPSMIDAYNNDFHFHDYCDVWKSHIPNDVIFDRKGFTVGYDDIECGIAVCWCFEPRFSELINEFKTNESNTVNKDIEIGD